jgi:hypothetical protein
MIWTTVVAILISLAVTSYLIRQQTKRRREFWHRPLRRRLKGPEEQGAASPDAGND